MEPAILPLLYNVPNSIDDWNRWSLDHANSHKRIIQAAAAQGHKLTLYQFDPIDFKNIDIFLDRNQQAHNEMCQIVNISPPDIQQVDLSNANIKRAWIQLHARSHHDVEKALGV